MHNPDLETPAGHLVFATKLSDGAPFLDERLGDFWSRMSAEGYIAFFNDNKKGPYTAIKLLFEPCLRELNPRRVRLAWHEIWGEDEDPCLNKKPKDFLENRELFVPFVHRLAVVAQILEQLPNRLPEAFPKLGGKFPLELATDLNNFLQDPDDKISVLDSKYGINIKDFAHDSDNEINLKRKIYDIGNCLKEILESY